MSIAHCPYCDLTYDQDYNVEHEDNCWQEIVENETMVRYGKNYTEPQYKEVENEIKMTFMKGNWRTSWQQTSPS